MTLMKTLIFTVAIFCIGVGVCSSYRIAKPIPITEITPTTLVELNATLEKLWDITNGRYNLNVSSTIPTATTATEGDVQAYYSGATYQLYVFINGGWRSFSSD